MSATNSFPSRKWTTFSVMAVAILALGANPVFGSPDGDLGITGLECDCTYYGAESRWIFRSEPRILGVATSGPAAGKLRAGDIILTIDGVEITSREGGHRFATVAPGDRAVIAFMRDGKSQETSLRIERVGNRPRLGAFAPRAPRVYFLAAEGKEPPVPPRASSPSAAPSPPLAPSPNPAPDPPLAPSPSLAPLPPLPPIPAPVSASLLAPRAPVLAHSVQRLLPDGYLGFAIECFPCEGYRSDDSEHPIWEFDNPPHVYKITPNSPATRAGLRRGDQITRINGTSITSKKGGRQFGSIQPGDRVALAIIRDGKSRRVELIAGEYPARAALLEIDREVLRELSREIQRMRDVEREIESVHLENLQRDLEVFADQLHRFEATYVPRATPTHKTLRYSGKFGDNEVQVHGTKSVIVTVDEKSGELIIQDDDVTVRIKRAK